MSFLGKRLFSLSEGHDEFADTELKTGDEERSAKRQKRVEEEKDEMEDDPSDEKEDATRFRMRVMDEEFFGDYAGDNDPGRQQIMIPCIDDGSMRFTRTNAFEYMRQHDIAERAAFAEDDKKTMTRTQQLFKNCQDIISLQIEKLEHVLGQFNLITEADDWKNIGQVSVNVERRKREAMQRYLTFTDRMNKLAYNYLQSRVQWGEQASLDSAQEEITSDACLSCAPFLFGDVWELCKHSLFNRLKITALKPWTVVMLPRQFGKTLLVSLMCAQLLYDCPQIYIIVFSVNQNSANRLLGAVKECLRLIVGKNENWLSSNSAKEVAILRPGVRSQYADGRSSKGEVLVNRIKAVPGKVDIGRSRKTKMASINFNPGAFAHSEVDEKGVRKAYYRIFDLFPVVGESADSDRATYLKFLKEEVERIEFVAERPKFFWEVKTDANARPYDAWKEMLDVGATSGLSSAELAPFAILTQMYTADQDLPAVLLVEHAYGGDVERFKKEFKDHQFEGSRALFEYCEKRGEWPKYKDTNTFVFDGDLAVPMILAPLCSGDRNMECRIDEVDKFMTGGTPKQRKEKAQAARRVWDVISTCGAWSNF